jgi:hypothetical protein
MAKIKFVVRELNKPSLVALSSLSQVVYDIITTKDTYSADKSADAGAITKLNSVKAEKTA